LIPLISYLDPGTGSFLLQFILAGLLGILFALRLFRDRVGAMFKFLFRRNKDTSAPDEETDE